MEEIITVKKVFEGGTSSFMSAIVGEYLQDNLWSHVEQHNEIVKEKRDLTLKALNEHLGDHANWVKPKGGLFIWVRFPETFDTHRLEELATQRGVRYDPGRMFSTDLKEVKALRLSYAHMPKNEIEQGVSLLADCVKRCFDEHT
jgi:2-aminoadipate transaminase